MAAVLNATLQTEYRVGKHCASHPENSTFIPSSGGDKSSLLQHVSEHQQVVGSYIERLVMDLQALNTRPDKDEKAVGTVQLFQQSLCLLETVQTSLNATRLSYPLFQSVVQATEQHRSMIAAASGHLAQADNAPSRNADDINGFSHRDSAIRDGEDIELRDIARTKQNPFTFDAMLVFVDDESHQPARIPCRGQMDTGSQENWISRRLIASTSLEEKIRPLDEPRAYRAFSGATFAPAGQVDVQWYMADECSSRRTTFLVGDDVPFDMVVGSTLIEHENLLARTPVVLGVRVVNPTKKELAELQKQYAERVRLYGDPAVVHADRKAKAAAERERARQNAAQGGSGRRP